jgi:lambda family phage tail tape measure protein
MTADVTTLVLAVDSTKVDTAGQALDRLAAKGKTAESATSALERTFTRLGGTSNRPLEAIGAAMDNQRTKIGLTALQLSDFGQRWRNARQAIADASKATEASGSAAGKAADQFRMNAYQAQQLSYQLNDLFVQIASGGSPLTALIQQGSQLSGTFGGIGGAMKAVLSVFTPARVAFGAAAAALGAFAVAAYKGYDSSIQLEKALRLTGGAAGYTRGQIEAMAVSLAQASGGSIGSAREALAGLVATGRFSGEALQKTAQAVILFQKATGASTDDVIKQFALMSEDVGKWAETANRSYHFVTAAQLQQIKTLQEQGRVQEAIGIAMEAFTRRVRPAAEALGTLERALDSVKKKASEFWDALLNIGRPQTDSGRLTSIGDQIAQTQKHIEQLRGFGPQKDALISLRQEEAKLAALRLQQGLLQEQVRLQNRGAEAAGRVAQVEQARIAFGKEVEGSLTRQEQREKEIARIRALGQAGEIDAKEVEKQVARINEKYKDLKGPDLSRSLTSLAVEKIKTDLENLTASYRNYEEILQAQRQAGLVGEKQYFDTKRALIETETAERIKAIEAENRVLASAKVDAKERIELDRQIAQNKGEIAKLQAEAATKSIVLNTQETAAEKARAAAVENTRRTLADYLEDLQRRIDLEDQLSQLGARGRGDLQGREAIADRFRNERRQLEAERKRLEEAGDPTTSVDARLQANAQAEQEAIERYEAGIQRRKAADADWTRGAQRAFEDYIDSAQNAAQITENLFTNAFRSLEDVLTDTLMKGRGDWKKFVNDIVAGITRIIVQEQLVKPLAQYLQSNVGTSGGGSVLGSLISTGLSYLFGGAGGAGMPDDVPTRGGRAIGGPVDARGVYEINERKRPEVLTVQGRDYLLMGAQRGEVKPTAEQQPQIVNNINIAAGVGRAELQQTAERLAAQIRGEQMRAARTGTGAFSRY